jgi:arabinogalactan oligomer/maltooligosaccharide transport system permease protein
VKRESRLVNAILFAMVVAVTVATLYPAVAVISISLRPGDRLLSTSLAIIPEGATLEAYRRLFMDEPFLRWLGHSTAVSAAVAILGTALASIAGYAFSRFSFVGKKVGLVSLLVTQMFPATMLLLPLYILLSRLHLLDSFLGLSVIYTATALPFCTWQMKGYYDTIPRSLEEAAFIDGASAVGTLWRVILPLAKPALAITGLFSFMSAWAEYLVAAQVLQKPELYTLPLGLKGFQSNLSTEWGLYAAGAVVVSVPIVILFLAVNRWLIGGLTMGSVKG